MESFDYDGRIGKAKNIILDINLKPNAQAPKTPNIRYDRERLQFLEKTIEEWETKGFIRRGKAEFLFSPVIVAKKGPKKFRLCYNFQPLNELMIDEYFDALDAEAIISRGRDAKVMCTIDLAAAH